jgi:hypothetical protein
MVLSAIFGKRKFKPGQLTQKEKYEAISMNPELNSWDTARYIYYNAKKLPESVIKRKQEFKEKEKRGKEIKRRTQRLRDVSTLRKTMLSKRKTTSSKEYGSNVIEKGTDEDIGDFLTRANININSKSRSNSSSKARGKKRTRKNENENKK